ncbi:MAG: hypothetical protein TECD_00200 [Hyphomicrobiaceae bacterium hypho_1]
MAVKLFAIIFFLLGFTHASGERASLLKAREGAVAQQQGQLELASQLYSRALEDDQLSKDYKGIIYTDRGVIHTRLGHFRQALEDFNNSVKLFPEHAATYNNRGIALYRLGYVKESIKDFDRAVILAPGYTSALNNRAAALLAIGELTLAIEDYTAAIKLAPGAEVPLAGRASVKIIQKRLYAALRDLNRALSINHKFALGYRLRGQIYEKFNDYSRATQDLSRSALYAPDNASVYLQRGRVYLKARKLRSAVADFNKAIELRSKFPEAYRERGHANVLLNNFSKAEKDLAKSMSLASNSGIALAYTALMHKKKGKPELGRKEIKKAIHMDPENPIILWAKGEIEEAMHEFRAAENSYRRALVLDPRFTNAQFGLARIGKPFLNNSEILEHLTYGPWSISYAHQRFSALHRDFPKLRVPIEMLSDSLPKILGWEKKKNEFRDIGVLKFKVGRKKTRDGEVDVEYAAIINLKKQTVMDLIPQRIGDLHTRWVWRDGRVLIIAADGLNTEHVITESKLSAPM